MCVWMLVCQNVYPSLAGVNVWGCVPVCMCVDRCGCIFLVDVLVWWKKLLEPTRAACLLGELFVRFLSTCICSIKKCRHQDSHRRTLHELFWVSPNTFNFLLCLRTMHGLAQLCLLMLICSVALKDRPSPRRNQLRGWTSIHRPYLNHTFHWRVLFVCLLSSWLTLGSDSR